ncbi:TPA: hypothetical protein U8251_002865 [Pseudomonas putida]|nr:hypothetical protein [Pseudomonas putida]
MNLTDCHLALSRLVNGKPTRISGAYKINYDSVSIEAGYPRGSIKKYNPTHSMLRLEIDKHYGLKFKNGSPESLKLKKKNEKIKSLKEDLDASLGREAMYIQRIMALELALRREGKVVPIK